MLVFKFAEQFYIIKGHWLYCFLQCSHHRWTNLPPISCNMRITRSQRWHRCESVCISDLPAYLSMQIPCDKTLGSNPAPMSPQYFDSIKFTVNVSRVSFKQGSSAFCSHILNVRLMQCKTSFWCSLACFTSSNS